ncbi:MAG: LamG-like jellyroll fold domain-containing protein, partial [Planctomycetota bacterium]
IDIDGASGGRLELGVGGGRTTGQGPSVNDGQWHMLTTVLPTGATNLSNVRLFVDGALAYTGSGNRALSTGGGDFILGHAANADWFQQFTGDIDEVVAWKRALSDGQVKCLYDITLDPTLGYSSREFESLLQVYDQQNPEVVLGNLTWQRATGLAGPAGLRVLQTGVRYELVFDAATGEGLKVVVPSRKEYFGAGCPGSSGVTPDILGGGDPGVGGALFAINLLGARATTPAVLLLNFVRSDLAIGNGCTLYPASPAIGLQALTNFGGQAFLGFALPPNPSLLGAQMFGQWAVADLGGAAGPGLAALTGGLRLVFGDS